jgi:hypothetical protein
MKLKRNAWRESSAILQEGSEIGGWHQASQDEREGQEGAIKKENDEHEVFKSYVGFRDWRKSICF